MNVIPTGVPQIEVVFDIDANGIMHVSAKETSSGRSSKIQISNEKGRLTPAEIDRMVAEAEQFKSEDDVRRKTVEAKNTLENLCYQTRRSLDEEGLKDKISSDDRSKIETALKDSLDWLDRNQLASLEEMENKTKELEGFIHPIMVI